VSNSQAAVGSYYGYIGCAPGLPSGNFLSCTTPCYQEWRQPAGTITCALTPAPTPAPSSPLRTTTLYPSCWSDSPLETIFAATPLITTTTTNDFITALSSLTGPTIIQLSPYATYTLDKVYPINTNLCIMVSRGGGGGGGGGRGGRTGGRLID